MLSVPMPDGYIAISARSGSHGNLMDTSNTEQKIANANDSKSASNASVDEVTDFAKDLVGPLRSTASTRSILKQTTSQELDSQGSGKIKRAVSWHDFEGKNLHTVREFTPR